MRYFWPFLLLVADSIAPRKRVIIIPFLPVIRRRSEAEMRGRGLPPRALGTVLGASAEPTAVLG